MIEHVRGNDPRLGAAHDTLAPCAWRRLSTEMLARLVVGALYGHWVDQELGRICGAPGEPALVEPASRDDERVAVVARALDGCRWRSLTLAAICRQSLAALDAWRRDRQWLEIELACLLDEG